VWYIRTAISKEPAVCVIRTDELSMYPDAGCDRFLKRIRLHGVTSQRTIFGPPWERQTSQEGKQLEMGSDYSRMIEVRAEHVLVNSVGEELQFEIVVGEIHCVTIVKPSWRHFLPHRAFTHKELTSQTYKQFAVITDKLHITEPITGQTILANQHTILASAWRDWEKPWVICQYNPSPAEDSSRTNGDGSYRVPLRYKQQIPPKRLCLHKKLHGITPQTLVIVTISVAIT